MLRLPFGMPPSVALAPVDLAAAAANTNYASVRDINRCLALLFFCRVGASGENVTVSLQQATTAGGANAKAMQLERLFFKKGAPTFATAPAVNDKFVASPLATKEAPIASWATATDRVAATNEFMGMILIRPHDLDMAGGFSYVRAQFTDPGATAQLAFALWLPEGLAYAGQTAPSILE